MRASFFWGIIIILIGFALILNNLGITDLDIGYLIATYWPVIFIIWGLETITERRKKTSSFNLIFGGILLFLGIAIISRNLGYYEFDFSILWRVIWPLIIILIGINILRSGAFTDRGSVAIMSGIEKKQDGWELTDQNYLALMGGIELDLRVAEIPEGETTLELTAIMGGIDIKAPEDVTIICRNTTILGGIDFFNDGSGGIFTNKDFERKVVSNKTIVIYSRCIMGVIEIR